MSKESFPHLFEPLQIGDRTLENRIVHAPMSVCYADEEGYVTREEVEHYARRAQGGASMVVTENFAINESGRQLPRQTFISEEKYLPGLEELASEIKKHGALAIPQVVHAGRYAGPWTEYEKRRRLAPSAIPFPLLPEAEATPQEITRDEIRETIEAFGNAARLAEEAGFDGVEIHGAQGFLVSGFLSPHMNRRTDEYGGSFENRIRFALEVVQETKARVAEDFIVGFQLMSDELMPGGWTLEEAVEFAGLLEQEGIHFIIPASATFESMKLPENQGFMGRPMFQLKEATAIKQAVQVPIIANGKLGDPDVAERILKDDEADAIGLARPLFTDPDWLSKVETGRADEIRTCPCNPPTCLMTQLTGSICNHWPPEIQEQGYLGYNTPPEPVEWVG